MKAFGYAVLAFTVVGAFLYFGGYVGGSADVTLTQKGRATVSDALKSAQEGVSAGLQKAQEGVNAGLQKAQEKTNEGLNLPAQ